MTGRDMAMGAAALKRMRHSRGLSLADTARALLDQAARLGQSPSAYPSVSGVQRSVARWESASSPILPGERYQVLLAHHYARTPAGAVALGPGSDFAELLDALAHLGEGEARLAELRTLVLRTVTDDGGGLLALLAPATRSALTTALTDPTQADEGLVASLRTTIAEVNSQVGSLPFVRLQLLLTPVVEACQRLLDGPIPAPRVPVLRATAVSACTLAARLAFETRDDTASRSLYQVATTEAGHLADPWQRATVHMSHALVTLYSTPGIDAARRLVDQAVRDARGGGSPLVRARAHALQAEIAARAGQERHAQAALSLAWYDMDRDLTGDPAPTTFSRGHLKGFEGVCELHVGDAAAAHDYFGRSAAALTTPRERVQRAIVTTDQALARVRIGEPRAACDLLHDCIDLASGTGARVPAMRLRRARAELRNWRREDFVADLDDHLHEAFLGS